jgi:hypothetical protein
MLQWLSGYLMFLHPSPPSQYCRCPRHSQITVSIAYMQTGLVSSTTPTCDTSLLLQKLRLGGITGICNTTGEVVNDKWLDTRHTPVTSSIVLSEPHSELCRAASWRAGVWFPAWAGLFSSPQHPERLCGSLTFASVSSPPDRVFMEGRTVTDTMYLHPGVSY